MSFSLIRCQHASAALPSFPNLYRNLVGMSIGCSRLISSVSEHLSEPRGVCSSHPLHRHGVQTAASSTAGGLSEGCREGSVYTKYSPRFLTFSTDGASTQDGKPGEMGKGPQLSVGQDGSGHRGAAAVVWGRAPFSPARSKARGIAETPSPCTEHWGLSG